ncbi:MAG TPA: HEAT repeat domain-containing protein [Bryobacteraceae bacterium]|nr:HEAT repeat domain-containing protein [Bryobacteraceae bacterium]
MTTKHRSIVMAALFAVPAVLALSQEPPAPPAPPAACPMKPAIAPRPFKVWMDDVPLPGEPPMAPMELLTPMAPMPPMPPMAALAGLDSLDSLESIASLAPTMAMAGLASMPPFPPSMANLGLLAYQEARAGRTPEAARAQAEIRRSQDREERYYRQGKAYLDRKDYDKAIDSFSRVIEEKGARADGALYWRGYAQLRLGKREEGLASLNELLKTYPNSRWLDDAKALIAEGGQVSPESASDEDMKLIAINALMNTEPERAVPLLEKLLKSSNSPRVKDRALFVLAQSHSQRSREVLGLVAKGGSNPDLQAKAIEYLGVYGGRDNAQILADIYKSTNDVHVKRSILNSFMVSNSKDSLLAVAKSETNPELKTYAIQLLGNAGGYADLAQLYAGESSPEVKKAIIQGLFVSGNSDKLFELAKSEKDDNLRHLAINQLGVMGKHKTGPSLAGLYGQETNLDNKKAIINALFIQGNAAALVDIARKENDMNLKKAIVNQLSMMHSKEATDYLMEILSK